MRLRDAVRRRAVQVLALLVVPCLFATAAAVYALRADGQTRASGRARVTPSAPVTPGVPWGASDVASITLLRHAVTSQAGEAAATLAHCEALGRAAPTAAAARYLRCALPPLAHLRSSGAMNSTILLRLINRARPSRRCDALIRSLAGTESIVAMLAGSSLRNELGAATRWSDVARASRAVRAIARDSRRVARAPDWRAGCTPATPAVLPDAA